MEGWTKFISAFLSTADNTIKLPLMAMINILTKLVSVNISENN